MPAGSHLRRAGVAGALTTAYDALLDGRDFGVGQRPARRPGFHVLARVGREPAEPQKWAQIQHVCHDLSPLAHKDVGTSAAVFGAFEGAPKVIVSDPDETR